MCRAKVMPTYEKQWDDCGDDVTSIQFVDAHSWLDDYNGYAFVYVYGCRNGTSHAHPGPSKL
jgi:hypothetical protein